ncbi:antA/AntB antirepressor family protein [Yersinia enterocolitica]|nr:antA/AntB antirepressor family protein [Yersinia enterocolitica]MBW5853842.1 antA/AntB antirepressor family protein [Yersinia enterocolitica]MBW5857994.1 antA/AntB antirepressor family protein [Yersinia enterocolitica]HEI6775390.1 antA/AntB antirepressor family protein [Yersinia enterocolitica]HEI6777363.1 antA/AntB antirepressor family protein [Yersinia enterocolitica]
MTNQLIPVFDGTISNETTLLCNARDLHAFLGIGKRFATWITERISEYEFVENQDYIISSQNREKIGRGRPCIDYHLTLDTAKELAMVERNEKGRQIRRYFIVCEKKPRQLATSPEQSKHSKVLLRFYGEKLISSQRLPDNYFIGPIETFIEVLKRKGLLVINPDDLKKIAY